MKDLENKLREWMERHGVRKLDLLYCLLILLIIIGLLFNLLFTINSQYVLRQELESLKATVSQNEPSDNGEQEIKESGTEEEQQTAEAEKTGSEEPSDDPDTTDAVPGMQPGLTLPSAGGYAEQVDRLLAQMSLEEKVYQLFIVTPEVLVDNTYSCVTECGATLSGALEEKPVGGVILFSQNLEDREQTVSLISGMQECMADNGRTGMWIAVDEEGGLVARCADKLGTTSYKPMAVYGEAGDTDAVYDMAADIAADIAQFGFNLDFAPVADVDLNPQNELGNRIFSSDPQVVSDMVGAMVRGMQSKGEVSATLKHFPGLGAEGGNTHDDTSAYIDRTYEELQETEFTAFQGGIDAGADFVMVGHQIMSCAGDDLPSDLSETVVTEWLREDLGYDGIVVTDAHNMNTISGSYSAGTAALMAVRAGVDIVLMPTDLNAAYYSVYTAAKKDESLRESIDESVRRILLAKAKHGLLNE